MSEAEPDELESTLIRPITAERLICLCLMFMLPVFALTTWESVYEWSTSRYFSLPIVVGELGIISFAILGGARPLQLVNSLPRITKASLGIWLAICLITTVWAVYPPVAAIHLAITLAHLLTGFALCDFLRQIKPNSVAMQMQALIYGLFLYLVVILVIIAIWWGDPRVDWTKFGAGVSNLRQISFYGLIFLGLALAMPLETGLNAKLRTFIFLVAAFLLLDLSGSRAGMGGALITCCLALLLRPSSRGKLTGLIAAAFLVAAIPGYIIAPSESWGLASIVYRVADVGGEQYDGDFTSGRMDIWVGTVRAIIANPVFGYGEGQFRLVVPEALHLYNHPHNSLLQFVFQWGFLGTGALAIAAFPLAQAIFKNWSALQSRSLAAILVLTGIGAASMLDGALFYAFPLLIAAICMAYLVAALDQKDFSSDD